MSSYKIRTIRDLIYWEYSKLVAGSAVGNRNEYAFVMYTYKRLKSAGMTPSAILRENQMLVEAEHLCAYCGAEGNLQWEHIIPKSRGGPDTIDNMVQACRDCNASKGAKDLFEWYGENRRNEIPRIVIGKCLKIAFDHHESHGTLDSYDLNGDGKLDIYDLGAIFVPKK